MRKAGDAEGWGGAGDGVVTTDDADEGENVDAGVMDPEEEPEGDMDTGDTFGGEATISLSVCGTEMRKGLRGLIFAARKKGGMCGIAGAL